MILVPVFLVLIIIKNINYYSHNILFMEDLDLALILELMINLDFIMMEVLMDFLILFIPLILGLKLMISHLLKK